MVKIYGNELYHWGILGMKWGIRRYQNEDGTLTELGKERLRKKDIKWAHKNYNKLYNKALKRSKKELNKYVKKDLNKRISMTNSNGKLSKTYINEYNRKLAEIMTRNASDFSTPSGKAVKFVAKRGEVGAHLIISDQEWNINELKNGVYGSGRIGYKKNYVNMA